MNKFMKLEIIITGFAFSDIEFRTDMNLDGINAHIKNIFIDKLCNKNFELMVPMSGRLSKLNLSAGTELDGFILRRIYHQKIIYVRPTEGDIIADYPTDSLSDQTVPNNDYSHSLTDEIPLNFSELPEENIQISLDEEQIPIIVDTNLDDSNS